MSPVTTTRLHLGIIIMLLVTFCALASITGSAQTQPQSGADTTTNVSATEASATDKFRKALITYRPALRFDSGEDFFPLKADAITNNVGNRLTRDNNQTIAERQPGGKELRIGYLRGGDKYPNGKDILGNDKIILRHENKDDYFEDAARLQKDDRYRDRIYRRLILTKDDGRITGAWLQYWFFYYYNDFPSGARGGDHEGDWEVVQIKLDPLAKPVYAVYSHHGKGSKCVWRKIEKDGARPKVFIARGSHANYFRTGNHHPQDLDEPNDGKKPRNFRQLRPMSNSATPWLNWPGFWGSTKGSVPVIDSTSPKGPKMQSKMWDPEIFAGDAEADEDCND